MARRDVATLQRAEQLDLVVAGDAQGVTGRDHAHGEPQHLGGRRPPVDEVPEEHHPPPVGMGGVRPVCGDLVAEDTEELAQLGGAPVDVADDVEGAVVVAPVVPGALALDGRRLDLVDAVEHRHAVEALAPEPPKRAAQLGGLAPHDVRAEGAVIAPGVALDADLWRDVEHDRGGEHVVVLGQADQLASSLGLHARRVDDRKPASLEALAGDEVKHLERSRRRGLVVLVVADEPAAEVRGHDLGGEEVLGGEARLPRAARADEHHQAQPWDANDHRENTAICVGAPYESSSGPIPESATVYPWRSATPTHHSANSARVHSKR